MDIRKSIVVKRIPSFKPLLWVVLVSSIIFSLMVGYSFSQYYVKDLIHENNRLRDLASKLEISLADRQRQIQILRSVEAVMITHRASLHFFAEATRAIFGLIGLGHRLIHTTFVGGRAARLGNRIALLSRGAIVWAFGRSWYRIVTKL